MVHFFGDFEGEFFYLLLLLFLCDDVMENPEQNTVQTKLKNIKKYQSCLFLLFFEYLIFFYVGKFPFGEKGKPGVFFLLFTATTKKKPLRHGNVKQKYERQNLILIGGIFFFFFFSCFMIFCNVFIVLVFFLFSALPQCKQVEILNC